MESVKNKIRGSLIGGAIGDALGYPVEFMKYEGITEKYGESGITNLLPYLANGKAVISDDTQMTLFTAVGLLNCFTINTVNGTEYSPEKSIYKSYLDWYACQYGQKLKKPFTWLFDVEELHVPRAPGITCLNSLSSGKMGSVSFSMSNNVEMKIRSDKDSTGERKMLHSAKQILISEIVLCFNCSYNEAEERLYRAFS